LFGFSRPSPEHVSVRSLPAFAVFGVGHNPDPVAAVVGADSRSRNNDRPCGVAALTQVSEYPVKPTRQTDDSRQCSQEGPNAVGYIE
jgi:hypothetical protein